MGKSLKESKNAGAMEKGAAGYPKETDDTGRMAGAAAYQGKNEGELLEELKRITGAQRAAGQLDDAGIDAVAAQLAPMLSPEQRQKLQGILSGLKS